jgi:hypothetical protein
VALGLGLGLVLTACGASTGTAARPALPAHWARYRHLAGVVDLAGPHGDGSFTVAAAGRLFTWNPPGAPAAFARGPGGYSTPAGPEPYITLAGNGLVTGTHCAFPSGTVFAIRPGAQPGVIEITGHGRARRFAGLPAASSPGGITFDSTGHFGHKLLVTARSHGATTVLAIDCGGRIHTITTHAPAMEGGVVVAPASFGRFGGDLITPSETSGRVYAISPSGSVATLAVSGLPHGGDIGVESAGFVPPGFAAGGAAYLADRYSPHNRHPGTNSILRLPGTELVKAGVRAGDLLVATEGSARTIAVRCARTCTVRYIAIGPAVTHAEGHIAFTGRR